MLSGTLPIIGVVLAWPSLMGGDRHFTTIGASPSSTAVRRIIAIYDSAHAGLIERRDARQFREFLLSAPALFLEIGEKMGAMSHVTSFWQYRFPKGSPKTADADELLAIFEDFLRSFGTEEAA